MRFHIKTTFSIISQPSSSLVNWQQWNGFSTNEPNKSLPSDRLQLFANPELSLTWKAAFATILHPFKGYMTPINLMRMKVQFDQNFSFGELKYGVHYAFGPVSQLIYEKDYDSLQKMLAPSLVAKLRPVLDTLPDHLHRLLNLSQEDLMASFIIRCSIPATQTSERFVHFVAGYHACLQKQQLQQNSPNEPMTVFNVPPDRDIVANFVFTRKIQPVLDKEWTVTDLNYFQAVAKK